MAAQLSSLRTVLVIHSGWSLAALCEGGSLKRQIYKPLHGLLEDDFSSLTTSELETQRKANLEKNAWAVAEEVVLRVDDAPRRHGDTCQQ